MRFFQVELLISFSIRQKSDQKLLSTSRSRDESIRRREIRGMEATHGTNLTIIAKT